MSYTLELTDPELHLLQELLHGDEARLRTEIAHTYRRAFRDELRKREGLVPAVGKRRRSGRPLTLA